MLSSQRLRTSRFLVVLPVGGGQSFCGHAVHGRRRFLDDAAVRVVAAFGAPTTVAEAAAQAGAPREQVEALAEELLASGLLVSADGADDEPDLVAAAIRGRYGLVLGQLTADQIEDRYHRPEHVALAELTPLPPDAPRIRVLVLGWCAAQATRPHLEAEARRRGIRLEVELGFDDDLRILDQGDFDVVVLQPGHHRLLAPVLAAFPGRSPSELEGALDLACAKVQAAVESVARRASGRLLLVQGIARPQVSPLGVRDGDHPLGFFEAVARLDRAARRACAGRPDCFFVDEDALFAGRGKRWLLDDLVAPSWHHGFRDAAAHRLVGSAWLDAWAAWKGHGAIHCIVVDLDGTLWPGEIAADGFSFDDPAVADSLLFGLHGGLHEALSALRARGILLAAVSRNTETVVRRKWRVREGPDGDHRHLLGPDDFAAIRIDHRRKSELLLEVADSLQVPLDRIAFVDDSPVERAEVRDALPGVWVLGDDLEVVRTTLLTSYRFETFSPPAEAEARRGAVGARRSREEARRSVADHATFLASLNVRCRIAIDADGRDAARVAELLRRTTQLNTTGLRLGASSLAAECRTGAIRIVTLHVEDRFLDYGLVGAAVVRGGNVVVLVLSCRVLGLEVERVLLHHALQCARGQATVVAVPFTATDRNGPAHRLLAGAELEPVPFGFRLLPDAHVPAPPPHCEVVEAQPADDDKYPRLPR